MSATAVQSLVARATSRVWPADVGRPTGFSSSAARLLALGSWLAVSSFVVLAITHLAVYDREVKTLNADEEANLWTWASSGATFAAAVGALVLLTVRPAAIRPLAVLAVAVFFLSLDDAIGLHERIVHEHVGSIGPIDEGARVVWPILYLPMLVAVFGLIWTLASVVPRPAGRRLRLGLLLLAGAILAELVAAAIIQVGYDHFSFVYNVEVAVEEGAELSGWMLIATGLLATAIAWASPPAPASES